MQIKTAMRYNHTPVRMAIINRSRNNKCYREGGEKGTFLYCWWECKEIYFLKCKIYQESIMCVIQRSLLLLVNQEQRAPVSIKGIDLPRLTLPL